jgi:hypothetical protein
MTTLPCWRLRPGGPNPPVPGPRLRRLLLGYAALIFLYLPLGKPARGIFFAARGDYGWRPGWGRIPPAGEVAMPDKDRIRSAVRAAAGAGAMRGLAAYHANACVKCACAESHICRAEPGRELPAAKADEVIRFYRRYHAGRKARSGSWGATTPGALDGLEAVWGAAPPADGAGCTARSGDVASVIARAAGCRRRRQGADGSSAQWTARSRPATRCRSRAG